MHHAPRVDILIVTLCARDRAAAILRAVETTLAQEHVRANMIVVVNGRRYDPELFATLRRRAGVHVLYQTEPSIFLARRCAREHVTARYFGFLDDDDYLLPGALRARVDALLADRSADAVVSNGYLREGTGESLMLGDVAALRRDPLRSLMQRNWLATASTLFRTASIPADLFDIRIRSSDMTYLAFRLAREKRVLFLDVPTYRKTYSADSISLSENWALPLPETLSRLLDFDMPASVRRELRRKRARAAHDASDIYRSRGEARLAWRYHLRSLAEPRGALAFALYTRRLLPLALPGGLRARWGMPASSHR